MVFVIFFHPPSPPPMPCSAMANTVSCQWSAKSVVCCFLHVLVGGAIVVIKSGLVGGAIVDCDICGTRDQHPRE